jgi:dsDNA-specific endonuclease/ATPase MutS2
VWGAVPQILVTLATKQEAEMAKLVLDLHAIYNRSDQIETHLNRIIQEAVDKRIALVEIIPGKGSGQLKKRVLRFLNQAHIRALYHRLEKDERNFGRIFVHFRH